MATEGNDPSVGNGDVAYLAKDYRLIRTLMRGTRAIRENAAEYLPKFVLEDDDDWQLRVDVAVLTNLFLDSVRTIAAKPFSKEVAFQGKVSPEIKAIGENVDRQGNNLHMFSRQGFNSAVAFGLHGIWVDHTTVPEGMNLADYKAQGHRPYWCHIAGDQFLDLILDYAHGRSSVKYARWLEHQTEKVGQFGSKAVKCVREVGPGYYRLYKQNNRDEWDVAEEGPMSIAEVPLAVYYTGERSSPLGVLPPMLDLAHKQIEHLQMESALRNLLDNSAFPMLSANGMAPPKDAEGKILAIRVGPKAVLYAPSTPEVTASWTYVEPDGESAKTLAGRLEALVQDMRTLGLQPMMPRVGAGPLLATVSGIGEAKAHSAVQAWAIGMKDAIEQALHFTSLWLKQPATAEVFVHTDFGISANSTEDIKTLQASRASGDLSRETLWDEQTRRGLLGPQFDKEVEKGRLEAEGMNAAGNEDDLDDDKKPVKLPANDVKPEPEDKAA